jgi:hypothetical protein
MASGILVDSQQGSTVMEYDTNKIGEAVLALLFLTRCDDKFGAAAWKGHDLIMPVTRIYRDCHPRI